MRLRRQRQQRPGGQRRQHGLHGGGWRRGQGRGRGRRLLRLLRRLRQLQLRVHRQALQRAPGLRLGLPGGVGRRGAGPRGELQAGLQRQLAIGAYDGLALQGEAAARGAELHHAVLCAGGRTQVHIGADVGQRGLRVHEHRAHAQPRRLQLEGQAQRPRRRRRPGRCRARQALHLHARGARPLQAQADPGPGVRQPAPLCVVPGQAVDDDREARALPLQALHRVRPASGAALRALDAEAGHALQRALQAGVAVPQPQRAAAHGHQRQQHKTQQRPQDQAARTGAAARRWQRRRPGPAGRGARFGPVDGGHQNATPTLRCRRSRCTSSPQAKSSFTGPTGLR